MKTMSKILAAAIVLTFANNSFGQATGNSLATATIVEPISIENERPLVFGSMARGSVQSTVTVAPNGDRTRPSGDLTLVASAPTSAQFTVTGDAGKSFYIKLPDAPITISTTSNGGDNMEVSAFVSNANIASSTLSASGITGTFTFQVGATLTVKNNQMPGAYTGNFNVEVNYL